MPSPVLQLLLACGLLLAAVNTAVEAPGRRKMKVATEEDDRERERNQRVRYTASWAVEITGGGDKMADVVARRHGYRNLGKVGNFDNIYHFVLGERERARAPTNAPYTAKSSALLSEKSVGFADQQYTRPVYKRSYRVPRDPRFRQQWHLLNTGQYGDEYRGRDLKIEKVWMQGLSGCNVTVGVVDDGFEYLHPDLRENYAPAVSYDFVDGDPDPINDMYDWHGTRCAGLVSAAKDGEACGVGVAYNSKFGGLKLLGAFTDLNEASSLSYANDVIDIYSNSWGPCDEGCVDGPMRLTHLALKTGAERGRGGKGSIFVWANGNGGPPDDCAADGYSSSIYTISVGAIGVGGEQSWYDEECSAKMVSAYVTDHNGYSAVSTTATDELCVYGFGGTSAACPMVAGAIALTLEANANLTWRDIMYLVIFTSNPSITTGGSYTTNGAGVRFSRQFGFGVLDTEAMVARARHWISVPPQIEDIRFPSPTSGIATRFRPAVISVFYSGSITYLEHIVVNVTLLPTGTTDPRRGHISLEIRSPSGTLSTLLKYRSIDDTNRDYIRWPFMSVAFWGENPRGTWQLTIRSQSRDTDADYSNLRFQFYGTSVTPPAVARIPNRCHSDCARGCAAPGAEFCDVCVNLRNAYTMECIDQCPPGYTQRNGYCYNGSLPEPVCNSKVLSLTSGSCVEAGYDGCCSEGKCQGTISSSPFGLCHCDKICHNLEDCCRDIQEINCTIQELVTSPMRYMTLRGSDDVPTQVVPITDDGASPVIRIPVPFPIGSSLHRTVYVGTNGYISFDNVFTDYTPFEYPGNSRVTLVSPFFVDIDISYGTGKIRYEIHTLSQSPALFEDINHIINEQMDAAFAGKWLLLAEWRNCPAFGRSQSITNTFQGIVVTDFSESYAVYIYNCQDMQFSGSASIGFTSETYELFANHRLSGYNARNIGCVNSGQSDWVNLVYKLTREDLQPIQPTDLYDECELGLDHCEQECIDLPTNYVCSCYDGYALQRDGVNCFPYCHADFTTEVGEFNTPSWPDNYPQSFFCEWNVDLTETLEGTDYFLVLRVDSSAYGMESNCSEEYIQFFDGLSFNATSLGKFCGTILPRPIAMSGLEARVLFVASDEHPDHLRGVRVTYSVALLEDECERNNGGCEHICRDSPYSYTCECEAGYQLRADGKSCYDVDECAGSHRCNQVCTNTLGSYNCSCEENFALSADSRTCLPSCNATYTALSGSFQTPGWPVSYPRYNFTCLWTIDVQEDDSYAIHFSVDSTAYGILGRSPCPTEYLEFHDGLTRNAPSLGKFCFITVPDDVVTSSGQACVVFKAIDFNRPPSRKGARITYEAFRIVDECLIDNGGCEQICQNTALSFSCHCDEGYALRADGRSCDDVDECSLGTDDCEQVCVNVNGSYRCDCEEGYALNSDGRTCRISCGGNYTANSGSFHTPGWPTHYPLGFHCEWYINPENSSSNHILSLTVDDSHFGIHGRSPCRTDYLQFHDGSTTAATSLGIFCFLRAPETLYTTSSQAVVVFQASTLPHLPSRVGARITYQLFTTENECEVDNGGCEGTCVDTRTLFECQCDDGYSLAPDGRSCEDLDECSLSTHSCQQLCINSDGSYGCDCEEGYALNSDGRTCSISCGGNYTANSGSFHSPGWPDHYPLNFRCEWYIYPENSSSNTTLSLTVDDSNYGIHGTAPCSRDYLEFYDGNTTSATLLERFCGLTTPGIQYASSSQAVVVFNSVNIHQQSSRAGAKITYQLFELVDECLIDNGGCEQICQNTALSFSCHCDEGYALRADGRSCDDVDECSLGTDDCEQVCVNVNGSYRCDCEEGYALNSDGRTCRISCGGNYTANSGSFHTPGWPTHYPLGFHCEWYINPENSSSNHILSLTVDDSHFGIHGRSPCRTDYLQFHDGSTTAATSLGIFCFLRAPETLYTTSSQAVVVFQASTLPHLPSRVGARITYQLFTTENECEVDNGGCEGSCVDTRTLFECQCDDGYSLAPDGRSCEDLDECSLGTHSCQQLCINSDGSYGCDCEEGYALNSDGRTCSISCGGNYTANSGSFHSPGWPDHYPLNFRCEWYIYPENSSSNTTLSLTVDDSNYGIHGTAPCSRDYLEFYDGNTTSATLLERFCGLTTPGIQYASSSQAVVVFNSVNIHQQSSRAGAKITYQLFELVNECEVNNGGCEGPCVNTLSSFECQCPDGYSLAADRLSCEDVNECTSSHSDYCGGLCVNTVGSFHCLCRSDFRLDGDGRTCIPECGGHLFMDSGSIATPGWPDFCPSLSFSCEWVVETSNDTIIDFSFEEPFGIIGPPPCATDYIELIDGPRDSASLGKFCSLQVPEPVHSSTNVATVVFQASNQPHSPQHVGANITFIALNKVNECEVENGGCEQICVDHPKSFTCHCELGYTLASNGRNCSDIDECSQRHNCPERCVNTPGSFYCDCNDPEFVVGSDGLTCIPDCGGTLTAPTGTFSSPGWPRFYHSLDYRCTWILDVNQINSSSFDIEFNEPFGIHGRDPCRTDYVEVFDGIGEGAVSRGKFCFLRTPPVILTTSTRAMVIFQASTARHTPSRVGISVTYTTVQFGVNECLEDNGGCEHECVDTRRSFTCSCYDGYSLDSNERGCTDINECLSSSHGCEHRCVNTEGSYYCECNDGFALGSNGRSCSLDCGGSLPLSNGTFKSPGWPQMYPQLDFRCVWTIENIPAGQSVAFVIDKSAFGIHGSSPCFSDYVEFFNRADFTGRSVGRYCSRVPPQPVILTSDGVRIVFQGRVNRNRAPQNVGMRVLYTVLEDECATDNGGCEHTCRDTIFSYECECPAGYEVAPNGHNCIDADECVLGTHECAQHCTNTEGLYFCTCGDEFNLAPDGKTCIPVCGQTFTVPNGTFRTPGWPHFYPELDFVCEWIINVDSDYLDNSTRSVLKLVFNETAYGFGDYSNCARDHIKFYNGIDAGATESVARVCASEAPMPFTVLSTEVRVVFRGSSRPHVEGQVGAMVSFFTIEQEFGEAPCSISEVVGFSGNCREVDCGGTVYSMSGVLKSPNWPDRYSTNILCQWSIVLPNPDATLRLTVDEIDIVQSRSGTCFWDYVLVFDSSNGQGNIPELLSERLCGSNPPTAHMTATGNIVHVWYQSRNANNRGFSLSFSANFGV